MKPICPVVERCGGCPWLLSDESVERAEKLRLVQRVLVDNLREGEAPSVHWIGSPSRAGYRNRIRLRVDSSGSMSFFNPEKSAECAVLEPGLQEALEHVRHASSRRPELFKLLAHAEIRTPDLMGTPSFHGTPRPQLGTSASHLEALRDLLESFVISLAGLHPPEQAPSQRFALTEDVYYEVPLGQFMQVNSFVNRLLVEEVVSGALERRIETFADLYSGAGNFSLPLAARGLEGVAVERAEASIWAMRRSAIAQGLTSLTSVADDALHRVNDWSAHAQRFELVIVDAPRSGSKGGYAALRSITERALALCSCNPVTFARDLRALQGAGFALQSVTALDMFPGTRHVEVLAWLEPAG